MPSYRLIVRLNLNFHWLDFQLQFVDLVCQIVFNLSLSLHDFSVLSIDQTDVFLDLCKLIRVFIGFCAIFVPSLHIIFADIGSILQLINLRFEIFKTIDLFLQIA